ncbi:MAG: Hsp20/alpha crystallin family protein, partial [Burkholderiales bacterium]|nr:Hsp20/alpha crystallin family protein [Burkholderiales bacterium]
MSETTAVARKGEQPRSDAALVPPVDVIEDASGITLYADLPGVPKDRLNLEIEAGTLTIEGEVALQVPEGMEATHVEVGLPRYRRAFTLSKELDVDKVV